MDHWNRRSGLTGLGALGASAWLAPSADALGLPDDSYRAGMLMNQRPDGSFMNR